MKTRLPMHEWWIILLFCSILLSLSFLAFKREIQPPPENIPVISSLRTIMDVKIEGEVLKPGVYRLPLNSSLRHLLELAEPLPSADLSQINYRRRLRDGQSINIYKRRLMTIRIAGAVETPGPLKILSGTRLCDLLDELKTTPDADLKILRKKKKYVKEGDLIEIPIKKIDRRVLKKNHVKKI